jgi:hypothetical protein
MDELGSRQPEPTKERPKHWPRRRHGRQPPVEPRPEPPPAEPATEEGILDDLDEVGAGGELAYQNEAFDALTVEFNTALRECDLGAFLVAREKYLAELRRILSNPNLEKRAREHFERIMKAAEETPTPIRSPCPPRFR